MHKTSIHQLLVVYITIYRNYTNCLMNESFRDLHGGNGLNSRVADLCSDMIHGVTTKRPPSGELQVSRTESEHSGHHA